LNPLKKPSMALEVGRRRSRSWLRAQFHVWLLCFGLFALPATASAADIVVGVPNWPSVRVGAWIIKLVIEERLGLTVELQSATNPVIFEAISHGAMHVHPEVWLPNQQALLDKYRSSVEVNEHPAAGRQGFCVNGAGVRAGIAGIADLSDPVKAKLLDSDGDGRGEFYNGAPGWSVTLIDRVRAEQYGYAYLLELQELDEGFADTQLAVASARGRPWVGSCYSPHHRFLLHPDLRFLQEPPNVPAVWHPVLATETPDYLRQARVAMAHPAQRAQPVFSRELRRTQPLVAALLAHMDLRADDLQSFGYAAVVLRQEPEEVARQWLARHAARVDAWLR
jgi:glycine betaine/proline transport system substrate-binding protein